MYAPKEPKDKLVQIVTYTFPMKVLDQIAANDNRKLY